jgi:hypothetical protein
VTAVAWLASRLVSLRGLNAFKMRLSGLGQGGEQQEVRSKLAVQYLTYGKTKGDSELWTSFITDQQQREVQQGWEPKRACSSADVRFLRCGQPCQQAGEAGAVEKENISLFTALLLPLPHCTRNLHHLRPNATRNAIIRASRTKQSTSSTKVNQVGSSLANISLFH